MLVCAIMLNWPAIYWLTLSCISVASVVSQDIVEWLVSAGRVLVYPHLGYPVLTLHALLIPSIDDTSVIIPAYIIRGFHYIHITVGVIKKYVFPFRRTAVQRVTVLKKKKKKNGRKTGTERESVSTPGPFFAVPFRFALFRFHTFMDDFSLPLCWLYTFQASGLETPWLRASYFHTFASLCRSL